MEPHRRRMVCMLSSLHRIRLYGNGNGEIEDGAAMELPSDCMTVPIVPWRHRIVWRCRWEHGSMDRGWGRHGTAVGLYGGGDRSMAASDCMAVPMGAWLDG
jgi:hypothetical protein